MFLACLQAESMLNIASDRLADRGHVRSPDFLVGREGWEGWEWGGEGVVFGLDVWLL